MTEFKRAYGNCRRYDHAVILEVVRLVESGQSRKGLCKAYGMSPSTLGDWLRHYGTASYHAHKKVKLTAAQRRSIICSVIQGRSTIATLAQQYKIRTNTIRKWVRIFIHENGDPIVTHSEMKIKKPPMAENDEIKALKQALAESQLKVAALETMVEIAERELKIDIRKKSGAKQSPK